MTTSMDIGQKSKDVAAREDEGRVVHLRDEIGNLAYADDAETQPITMTVAGTYSARYRRAFENQTARAVNKQQRNLSGEQLTAERAELAASCVLGWDGITRDGESVEYSRKTAIELLTIAPWIRDQVEEAMKDHAGFTKSSSPS